MKNASLIFGILLVALQLLAQTNQSLRVAVLDSVMTGEASVGLADFIEAGLQREGVETYDRNFLRLLLAERGLSKSGIMDMNAARLAQLPTVEMFVRGEVRLTGTNGFALTLEAVRAADAVTAVSLNASGKYPQDWLPALERLLKEMSGRLRETQAGGGKSTPGRSITWMPEASLWFFRGLDCYANADYAQAVVAFGKARRWESHFRLAWLWESRSYQRAGFPAQARRVLEAGQLADKPIGQAIERPVLAIVAGQGVSVEEQQEFSRLLANSGKLSVLEPRWIGASAREVDLQLTGEMAARSESHSVWLAVDQVVFLERTGATFRVRKQDALTGRVLLRTETGATTNDLSQLAQQFLQPDEPAGSATAQSSAAQTTPPLRVTLRVNEAEAELSRSLDRAMQDRTNVRALIAAADACLPWQSDLLNHDGQRERGVEWRVREEFLAQAVAAIRQNPRQADASFLLASALWRQRYTPEYGIWAGSASDIPLREQMRLLLELFPNSADATNLAETISENAVHNKRSMPVDASYLQPLFQDKAASLNPPALADEKPDAEAQREEFRSLFYTKQLDRVSVLFSQLAFAHVRMDHHEEDEFLKMMLQKERVREGFIDELDLIIRTPDVLADTRFTTAYDLAVWCYQRGDYFRATELLREVLADDDSAGIIVSRDSANHIISLRDIAFALLKQVRLFGDGELDFSRCCGEAQKIPVADPAEMDALEALFKERMALTLSIGRPTAEKLDKTHQEMNRVEKAMLDQHRAALPAFLARKLKESGPGPELMGLCAQLGSQAVPLLPQIVAGVLQHDNRSTQCNALTALGNIGHPAASALPVVILAMESDDVIAVQGAARSAYKKLGVAPRRGVPYLARLLYHSNSNVALNAAASLIATAGLPTELRDGLTDDEFVQRVQYWWENIGSRQAWENRGGLTGNASQQTGSESTAVRSKDWPH